MTTLRRECHDPFQGKMPGLHPSTRNTGARWGPRFSPALRKNLECRAPATRQI